MGINNRQRRAAKLKQRARRHGRRSDRGGWQQSAGNPYISPPDAIRGLLQLAASADDPDQIIAALAALAAADAALVDRESEGELLRLVAWMWENGWQPAEVIRHARRADARAGRLVAAAVAADHSRRDPATLHPRWAAQLDAMGGDLPEVAGPTGWVTAFGRRELLARPDVIASIVTSLGIMVRTGRLQTIIPPPGARTARSMADADPTIDDPVLVRVRALLAQAESTTFEAEAEAFTAKAQELMARHAIDAAVLWASSARDERPISIRLPIDDPYADIKSLLLQRVAHHSRCTAVWNNHCALSTVVGFASDVAATEMLFTSLLVQSQTAMRAEGAKAGPGARARSRGFRSSFLLAFSHRIDQRLAEINAAVEQAAQGERTDSLLPVLASRDDAVRDAVAGIFSELCSYTVRGGSDAAGWVRGTLAADLAKLNFGDLEGDSAPTPKVEAPMLPFG